VGARFLVVHLGDDEGDGGAGPACGAAPLDGCCSVPYDPAMRLAFLADASLPHTVRWVNHFARRGHDCLLLSLEPGSGYECAFEPLPAHAGWPRFLRYTLEIQRAAARLRAFAPGVVNAHFVPNYGWMAVRAGLHPLVVTTLGSDVLTVPSQSPLHRWRTAHVLQRADAVTSDAHMLTDAILGFGVAGYAVTTVPFGIEATRFATPPVRDQSIVTLFSSRRLEPVYDVGTLVRAWARLSPEERRQMPLRIAGTGSETAALQAQGAPLGANFVGWLATPELDRELAGAQIYVSTSKSDSTSVSLLEAMAAGCFPVVSDLPANQEWVEHERTALLFPPGDDAALAACLRRAAADPALRSRAAEQNRATVRERATWESNMAVIEALFERLAGLATVRPERPPH